MSLTLIKLLCFISTSAHTNYLIYLLKSVAFNVQPFGLSSQARCVFYSTPWLSQPFYLRTFSKFSNEVGDFLFNFPLLKACVKRRAFNGLIEQLNLFQWPFPVAVSSEEAHSTPHSQWVNRGSTKKCQFDEKQPTFYNEPLDRHFTTCCGSGINTKANLSPLRKGSYRNIKTAWRRFFFITSLF